MKLIFGALLIALGVAAAIAGERDDSPGLFFIGVLIVTAALTLIVRTVVRRRKA